MRVLVTGSRTWEGHYAETRIRMIMDTLLALCEQLGDKLTVVHGDCPQGADQIVDRWARRRDDAGVTVEPHPAQWDVHGKSAGPIRNGEMVELGADMCLAFLRNDSAGTRNCLAASKHAGIPTFTIAWEKHPEGD